MSRRSEPSSSTRRPISFASGASVRVDRLGDLAQQRRELLPLVERGAGAQAAGDRGRDPCASASGGERAAARRMRAAASRTSWIPSSGGSAAIVEQRDRLGGQRLPPRDLVRVGRRRERARELLAVGGRRDRREPLGDRGEVEHGERVVSTRRVYDRRF